MTNKERCLRIIDSLDESQLVNIAVILEAVKHAIDEAAAQKE